MSKTPKEIHLNMRGVGKVYPSGTHALANVDLQIPRGQFVSIVGPSGCGKSTLIRLVAGLDNYTSGTLTIDGYDPINARKKSNDLAYVFQDPTLLPWRNIYKNVTLPLELRKQIIDDSVTAIIETVGLSDFLTAFPSQLSGGMRMRVSIARALVTNPGLLLLDEPFGALDEITRQLLNEELLKLWERDCWTGLFITHNVYEAAFLADRVLVMSARPGHIIADIEVPFPHPRNTDLRHESSFTEIAHYISNKLEQANQ